MTLISRLSFGRTAFYFFEGRHEGTRKQECGAELPSLSFESPVQQYRAGASGATAPPLGELFFERRRKGAKARRRKAGSST
ncbi:MAG TPA: hypothetical protein VF574_01645, partial [Allosphingosinicella sp.]